MEVPIVFDEGPPELSGRRLLRRRGQSGALGPRWISFEAEDHVRPQGSIYRDSAKATSRVEVQDGNLTISGVRKASHDGASTVERLQHRAAPAPDCGRCTRLPRADAIVMRNRDRRQRPIARVLAVRIASSPEAAHACVALAGHVSARERRLRPTHGSARKLLSRAPDLRAVRGPWSRRFLVPLVVLAADPRALAVTRTCRRKREDAQSAHRERAHPRFGPRAPAESAIGPRAAAGGEAVQHPRR